MDKHKGQRSDWLAISERHKKLRLTRLVTLKVSRAASHNFQIVKKAQLKIFRLLSDVSC